MCRRRCSNPAATKAVTTSGSESTCADGAIIRSYRDRSPKIDRAAWIAPGAVIVGDVELGRDVSIWYGVVLRGDVHEIRIGARTNIQDGSILHVSAGRFGVYLGEEVTVGHRAVVHGCRVGDGALIGIGAVVLDGATIGAGALVAAGSVVTPGADVPAGMLAVGVPARAVRPIR